MTEEYDYWTSSDGISQRIGLLCDTYTYKVYNGAIQVVGAKNDVWGFEWVGSTDERTCNHCDMNIGRQFRLGWFMAELPYHANCRCEWRPIDKGVPINVAYKKVIFKKGAPETDDPFGNPLRWAKDVGPQDVRYLVIPEGPDVAADKKISHEYADECVQQYLNLPEKERQTTGIYKIKILSQVVSKDSTEEVLGAYKWTTISGKVSAKLEMRGMESFDPDNFDQQMQATETFMTLTHEVGHGVYYGGLSDEQRRDWTDFWEQYAMEMPTDYGKTSAQEGFAETYMFMRGIGKDSPEAGDLNSLVRDKVESLIKGALSG